MLAYLGGRPTQSVDFPRAPRNIGLEAPCPRAPLINHNIAVSMSEPFGIIFTRTSVRLRISFDKDGAGIGFKG